MKSQKTKKTPARSTTLGQVRIIGGEYRRRLVSFVDADGLRPTPDRLRETLFNWLQHDLPNANVLDCCAGSGVLGFEAISRGATSVTMIEPSPAQYQQLLATVTTLQLPSHKITIQNATAQTALLTLKEPFDIIFLDPPYRLNLWQPLLLLLRDKQLFNPNTYFYIEADTPLEQVLGEIDWLMPIKSSKIGQIYAGIFQPVTNLCTKLVT